MFSGWKGVEFDFKVGSNTALVGLDYDSSTSINLSNN